MKIKVSSFLINLTICFLFLSTQALAQPRIVVFDFEVDGKQVEQEFKVIFEAKEKKFEAKSGTHHFIVPAELQHQKSFAVHFISEKYHLFFDALFIKDLNAHWTIGVDHKPFERDNLNSSISYDNVCVLDYLGIKPNDGAVATRIITKLSDKSDQCANAPVLEQTGLPKLSPRTGKPVSQAPYKHEPLSSEELSRRLSLELKSEDMRTLNESIATLAQEVRDEKWEEVYKLMSPDFKKI